MKSLKTKLALSAVAVAMLASPALAQPTHPQTQQQVPGWYDSSNAVIAGGRYQGTDPDPNVRLQLEKDGGDYGPSAY
jgi:opacity protein-like surface antigen